jgi:hypothetical protein
MKLADALAACRVHGAKLIIAKLDRLARNAAPGWVPLWRGIARARGPGGIPAASGRAAEG